MNESPPPTPEELQQLYADALALQQRLGAFIERLAVVVAPTFPQRPPASAPIFMPPSVEPPPLASMPPPEAPAEDASAGVEPDDVALDEVEEPAAPIPMPPREGERTIVLENDPATQVLLLANGIAANTGKPLLAIDLAGAAECARIYNEPPDQRQLQRLRARLASAPLSDPLDTAVRPHGWALVVSANDDATIIEVLLPLIQHRATQHGLTMPAVTFVAGETCEAWLTRHVSDVNQPTDAGVPVLLHHDGEGVVAWLERHGAPLGPLAPRRGPPFYLLIAAQPTTPAAGGGSISLTFQSQLDIFYGVGRICFTDDAGEHRLKDYRTYAKNLIAYEKKTRTRLSDLLFFAPTYDGDRLSSVYASDLILPLAHGLSGQQNLAELHGMTQRELIGSNATRTALVDALTTKAPTMLFAAAHGLGMPIDDPALRELQGSLICADWTGSGAVGSDQTFGAQDLPEKSSLNGTIAILVASYSVGCLQNDETITYGNATVPIAPRAMIGQLPQRMLTQGALAVIGYYDRAWGMFEGITQIESTAQSVTTLIDNVLSGEPLGSANEAFARIRAGFAQELSNWLDDMAYGRIIDPHDLGKVWVAYQTVRGLTLLGDPLVRVKST